MASIGICNRTYPYLCTIVALLQAVIFEADPFTNARPLMTLCPAPICDNILPDEHMNVRRPMIEPMAQGEPPHEDPRRRCL
ncbi:hypothetical protein FHS54_003285 [Sphingobium vermicomposti]|uniref:Uncharacterized protein n=1 Tax=Sphingobium vermicomposti TaxID=529005 RepID=A0A846MH94_9SPHN|nr:hypothetical protein [Sphingobium vermicomposti]